MSCRSSGILKELLRGWFILICDIVGLVTNNKASGLFPCELLCAFNFMVLSYCSKKIANLLKCLVFF